MNVSIPVLVDELLVGALAERVLAHAAEVSIPVLVDELLVATWRR